MWNGTHLSADYADYMDSKMKIFSINTFDEGYLIDIQ
jgi:hypothetical protein